MEIRGASPRTARQAFRSLMHRDPGSVGNVTIPLRPQQPLPRAALPHYWHPDRAGVEHAPADFDKKLKSVSLDLAVCRAPMRAPVPLHAWGVWYRKAAIQHPLCPGWLLLALWKVNDKPLPLDDRLFAFLHHCDRRTFGSAVAYFDAFMEQRRQEKQRRHSTYMDDLHARGRDFFQSTKIKNIGAGNKYALHHDGTILPSKGERDWQQRREYLTVPAEYKKEQERRRDEKADARRKAKKGTV